MTGNHCLPDASCDLLILPKLRCMYCGNRALDEDSFPLRVRHTLQSECQAVFVITSVEMDGTQWGKLWNRLFEIYSVALHKFEPFLSHSAIHGKLVHRDAWCVADVHTALIVGHSGDTIASTFPHWLLLFRHIVKWEYNNLTSQPQLMWLFGRAVEKTNFRPCSREVWTEREMLKNIFVKFNSQTVYLIYLIT